MAERQTRETLRKFFSAGQLPTEEHFHDLVESTLNMRDEGFSKTPHNGLEIVAAADKPALASFYRSTDTANPVWSLRYGSDGKALQWRAGAAAGSDDGAVLCLVPAAPGGAMAPGQAAAGPGPRVGIATAQPQHTLDVAGVVASQGRVGRFTRDLPADGQPQVLIDRLAGCQAYEVVAGVGGPEGDGRYALLHAVALNTYNPAVPWWTRLWPGRRSPGIRVTEAHYGRRCDRLELWWEGGHGKGAEYRLMVRTRCHFGPGIVIRCHVTQLWLDPAMAGSRPAPGGAEAALAAARGAPE
jgi:hypothetical protein